MLRALALALLAVPLLSGCASDPGAATPGILEFYAVVDDATLGNGTAVEALLTYKNVGNTTLWVMPFGSCDGRGGFAILDENGTRVADNLAVCGLRASYTDEDLIRVGPHSAAFERRTVARELAPGTYTLRSAYVAEPVGGDEFSNPVWLGSITAQDGFAVA